MSVYKASLSGGLNTLPSPWADVKRTSTNIVLPNESGTDVGVTIGYTSAPPYEVSSASVAQAGTGDASWVIAEALEGAHGQQDTATWVQLVASGFTPGNSFNVRCFGSYNINNDFRSTQFRVNGGADQELVINDGTGPNTTDVVTFLGVTADVNGEILIEWQEGATSTGRGYANAVYIEDASAADTTPPTVSSASVPTAGDTIAVQMSEAMQVGAGGSGGWTISLGDATISAAAVDGTDDTIINLTPSRTLLSSDSFTIGYTQPVDGFQDKAATPNDLATLSGQAVTNNSTQTAATLSISAADNITSEGQTATFTLANNSGAPTGATLNGTDVGTLTDQGSGVYAYTAPLIPDDATADLVVSVDSTTVSTQISYANSYPYELVTHGTPEVNSVMEGNQFATTQPVELKVITDTNASIADIDWQAMSDNQQWLTDIRNANSVTSVADGSTSFTLGYFVQETGATGTFERTVTTTDTLSPAIDSVSVPTAGTYYAGDVLSFTVNWNESVTVTGTPALNLTIGGSARQANYASGTGTSATVFNYTVQSGEEGAVSITSLTLDGGTIKDAVGNDATLTLNSIGDTSGVLVDGVAPSISIFPLTTLDTSPIVSGSAGDATSLTLVVTGVGTYTPTPSGGTWSQQLTTLALGDYAMTLNGMDAAGNAAIEASATLRVVDELSNANSILQPVLKSILSPIFEDVA